MGSSGNERNGLNLPYQGTKWSAFLLVTETIEQYRRDGNRCRRGVR